MTTPSDQDIELTTVLQDILKVIDVRVLDHLVVGDKMAELKGTKTDFAVASA